MDASVKDLPPDIPSGNAYYRADSIMRFHVIAFGAGHRAQFPTPRGPSIRGGGQEGGKANGCQRSESPTICSEPRQ
jgi:hypothetical protein